LEERGLNKKNKVIFNDKRFNKDNPPLIIGNFDEINQVFMNLIENAIKYGFEDTDVDVQLLQLKNNELNVKIINKGEGIPKKYIERLTERFFRVDKARSSKIGGTGLGLAIVKHILIRHRASLRIKSEINKKTTFSIKFPLV
jgi:two-component system phosphate regulon sensor histidine kinase PhoR